MKLLVSVANILEAKIAQQAGVDIIDLKEPSRGSLGPVDSNVIHEVVANLRGKSLLSCAQGELVDRVSFEPPKAFSGADPNGLNFRKIGLAGCRHRGDWRRRWTEWSTDPHQEGQPVMVAYADWQRCAAPELASVVDFAVDQRPAALLVDTCIKDGQSLFDVCHPESLQRQLSAAERTGIPVAIAGSLRLEHWDRIRQLAPAIVAVRGAVCHDRNRQAPISKRNIAIWLDRTRNHKALASP